MRIQRFFLSFFLFLSVCVPAGSAPADEYAGFIRDALQKWDEYLSGLADMECTVRVTTHYPPDLRPSGVRLHLLRPVSSLQGTAGRERRDGVKYQMTSA